MRFAVSLLMLSQLLLVGCRSNPTSTREANPRVKPDAGKVAPTARFTIAFRMVELALQPDQRRYQVKETLTIKNRGNAPLRSITLYFNDLTATFLSCKARRITRKLSHRFVTDWIGLIPQKRMVITVDPPIPPGGIAQLVVQVAIASRAPFNVVGPKRTTIIHSSPILSRDPLWTNDRLLQYSKARFSLVVTTPEDTTVITPLTLLRKVKAGDRWRHLFKPSPVAGFLTVVSGDYQKQTHTSGRGVIELWTRRSTKLHPSYEKTVLPLLGRAFDWYQQRFGTLPLKTLRVIEFENRHDGKELAAARGVFGAMLLPTTWLTTPFSEPWRHKTVVVDKRRAVLHELAHSWWIGAVTPRGPGWWWITEGFSNYLAAVAAGHLLGLPAERALFQGYRRRWLKRAGAREPALTEISILANREYLSLHYDRGALVLLALHDWLGRDKLAAGIRAFLKASFNGYTTIAEFERVVSREVGRDIRPLIAALVRKAGVARYRIVGRKRVGNRLHVTLKNDGSAAVPVPLVATTSARVLRKTAMVVPGKARTFTFDLDAAERVTSLAIDPDKLRLNVTRASQTR